MILIAKFLRKLIAVLEYILNSGHSTLIACKYPNIILRNNQISRGTIIKATVGSTIKIENSFIMKGSIIIADHNATITIRDSFIGYNTIIVARSYIEIKENCQIAEMVVIRDQNHNFSTPNKTITEQGFTTVPIIIEENVWLGAKVTVTAGSHIGKNTVVGANAVVRGSLDANSVYAGIPAKKIKSF